MATETLDDGLNDELAEFEKELEEFEEEDDLLEDSFEDDEIEGMSEIAGSETTEEGFDEEEEETVEDEQPTDDSRIKQSPFLILAIAAIVIGGLLGGGALWLMSDPPEAIVTLLDQVKTVFEEEEEPAIADVTEEVPSEFSDTALADLAMLGDTMVPEMEATPMGLPEPVEASPPPRIKKYKYSVQVARCLDQECVEDYRLLLKRYGLQAKVVTKVERTPIFEIVSKLPFSAHKATQWVKRINGSYHVTGEAFRQREGEQYRISLGWFPDRKTADHVQSSMNLKYAGQMRFDVKLIQQKTLYYLIRTRSFDSQEPAIALQNRLKGQEEQFNHVWLITNIYYL